jgi:hypothetical protein
MICKEFPTFSEFSPYISPKPLFTNNMCGSKSLTAFCMYGLLLMKPARRHARKTAEQIAVFWA